MFNLLNFPYNLEEMMQELETGEKTTPEEALANLIEKNDEITLEHLASYLGITINELVRWTEDLKIPSDIKLKLKLLQRNMCPGNDK